VSKIFEIQSRSGKPIARKHFFLTWNIIALQVFYEFTFAQSKPFFENEEKLSLKCFPRLFWEWAKKVK
jgi:hypothetical protein